MGIAATALDIAAFRYPPFVYGGACRDTPVFCFHEVEHETLEAQLSFLAANGYQTITSDELFSDHPEKSVMLTFDDGWGSLWTAGLPLLKKYEAQIVVFLAAGRIGSGPFLTWDQIGNMHETGLVDFQSHTLTHTRVFCSPKVEDFAHPSLQHGVLDAPEWEHGPFSLGRPIYRSHPRLGDCRRYLEDSDLRLACESYVQDHGGESFFKRPDWRASLRNLVSKHPPGGRFETDDERQMAVWRELDGSKRMIEEHLGKPVRHVCYPWHCYSRLTVDLSGKAGYEAGFVGKVSGRYHGARPGRPTLIARVGGDFFFRLPGKGRMPLFRILLSKLSRRVRDT